MARDRVWHYARSELHYYATVAGLALMAPLSLLTLLWLLPAAQVGGNWHVEGASGVLQIRGAMTESACRLEMDSARQDIRLGTVGTGRLQQLGDRGDPVVFELRLRDCLRSFAGAREDRSGALSWAANQPAVTISFSAPADADNPQLVKLRGVSGIGLRLTDRADRDVRLGGRGAPLLLTPGSHSLAYRVATERTQAPLSAGVYVAMVDFRLNYD